MSKVGYSRVTHPSAANPSFRHPGGIWKNIIARLACVRRAASVRPEPGSNSQLKFDTALLKSITDLFPLSFIFAMCLFVYSLTLFNYQGYFLSLSVLATSILYNFQSLLSRTFFKLFCFYFAYSKLFVRFFQLV